MANEADKHRIAIETAMREMVEDIAPVLEAVLNDMKARNRVHPSTRMMTAALCVDGAIVFQLTDGIWGELPVPHNPTKWRLY